MTSPILDKEGNPSLSFEPEPLPEINWGALTREQLDIIRAQLEKAYQFKTEVYLPDFELTKVKWVPNESQIYVFVEGSWEVSGNFTSVVQEFLLLSRAGKDYLIRMLSFLLKRSEE